VGILSLFPFSPRALYVPGDEDFVGHVKKLAKMCHHPATMEQRVAEKLSLLCGIESYVADHPELDAAHDRLRIYGSG
jgi:hypothetical protein